MERLRRAEGRKEPVVERSESHYLRTPRLGALEEAKPKLVRDEGPTDLF